MSFRSSLITLAILIAGSCGGAITEQRPTATDAPTINAGQGLYDANCASCHGVDLRGTAQGPSHLSEVYVPGHHGDAAFGLAIIRGVSQHHWQFGDMPAVEGLDQSHIDAIVAYVRSVQTEQGFEPYPP